LQQLAMPRIEFIYEHSCPNIEDARSQLRLALEQTGLPAHWQEWEHSDPNSPAYARRYGSPSILVDGEDVAGEPGSDAPSCRIYTNSVGRNRGVPDAALIRTALEKRWQNPKPSLPAERLQLASLLPAVGAALLPKLTCPACWPAYAALLSAFGVGFFDYTPYLLPLTLVFLVMTLAILAWRPRRGYAPLALGLFAAGAMLIGKFFFDSDITIYTGVALLVGASTWNAWPARTKLACLNCKPVDAD
jgi:mercuric ion transport protein